MRAYFSRRCSFSQLESRSDPSARHPIRRSIYFSVTGCRTIRPNWSSRNLTRVPASIPCLRRNSAGTTSWPFEVNVALSTDMSYILAQCKATSLFHTFDCLVLTAFSTEASLRWRELAEMSPRPRLLQRFTQLDYSLRKLSNAHHEALHQCRYINPIFKESFVIRLRKSATLSIALCALSGIAFTTGCGSSSTQIRLVNAMDGQTSINMVVDNSTLATGVGFGAASSYASVGSGSHTLEIQANSATLFNQTVSVASGNNTVLATNSGPTIFTDNKTTPSSGNIQIRVMNASTSLGTADVYVVASGVDISTVNPTFSGLAYQSASSYATVPAGSYQIEFAQAGSKNVLINSNAISFSAGQIRTVVALDNPSGGFTTAVLSDLN